MSPIGRRLAPVGTEGPSERQLPPVRPVEKEEMKKKRTSHPRFGVSVPLLRPRSALLATAPAVLGPARKINRQSCKA